MHVEEYLDAGQQLLQLILDDRGGVLTSRPIRSGVHSGERLPVLPQVHSCRPYVAVEEVPREADRQHQLWWLLVRDEANRGDFGDAAGGHDGTDEEDQ